MVYPLASDCQRLAPFSGTFGVTSLLTEYPDIAAIADLHLQPPLAEELNRLARGHLEDAEETARQLHQVARDSYPLPDALRPTSASRKARRRSTPLAHPPEL